MCVEKWDVLNEDGRPTGRTTIRGHSILKPGEFHLVVHIWVLSSDGRYLIQRRADDKKLMPGEWAATGGAAIMGEDSFAAARRELFEELGIVSDRKTLLPLTRIKRRSSLLDVWMITADVAAESLTLQESEVAAVKWVTREQLDEMIASGTFHNYGEEYFNIVFSKIDDCRGAKL